MESDRKERSKWSGQGQRRCGIGKTDPEDEADRGMQVIHAVGREAASKKYDILSAMMAHALAGDKHRQRLVMRLMSLITTRYNWQGDELTIGQREIARLWSVDERTVKREMAKFRALGWLEQRHAGARGRVAVYSLGIARILRDTRPEWELIGPDFTERLSQKAKPVAPEENVIPFTRPLPPAGDGLWARAQALLKAEDAAGYGVWFAPIIDGGREHGQLELIAPSRFHAAYVRTHLLDRLRIAVRRIDPSVADVKLGDA